MPSVYIRTLGCQMNEQDSEVMRTLLQKEGYQSSDNPQQADLILINTCHIREKAYQKALSEIGRFKKQRKQQGKKSLIGIAGCVASVEGERLLKKYQIDFAIGTDQLHQLPAVVKAARDQGEKISRSEFQDISDYEFPVPLVMPHEKKIKAYVTIMKGCDNSCSFCVVPMTRGQEVSRHPDDILREIHQLECQGVREIMLLGQNVNSYGKHLPQKISFAALLRKIDEETSISRIRFTSPHPKDLSLALMEEYGRNQKLCPHIHLPAQSGSNRLLKKMRRSYTRETYLRRVEKIRQIRPDIAITTDLIVGFPGETEQDFAATLSLIREVGYDQCYSFEYSQRAGTEAAGFVDDVPAAVKRERLHRLQEVQDAISRELNRTLLHKNVEVLVEGNSQGGKGQLMGRTPHGKIVNFDGDPQSVGAIIKVKIEEISPYSLVGRLSQEVLRYAN